MEFPAVLGAFLIFGVKFDPRDDRESANRDLVKAILEVLKNAFKYSIFEASNWSRLKPSLKNYCRHQGNTANSSVSGNHKNHEDDEMQF